MGTAAWELIFMMLVVKLPVLYLIGVVGWAVRSSPVPFEPAELVRAAHDDSPHGPADPCAWRVHRRPIRPSPRVATRGARR